ncbi:hypothetical protein ACQRBK_01030 [Peptoniphilaceae bacterium SGI.137]
MKHKRNSIRGWNRTAYEERLKLAKQQKEVDLVPLERIVAIIRDGLVFEGIPNESYKIFDLRGLNEIRAWEKEHEEDSSGSIFISFDKDGRVVVVGAGEKKLTFPDIKKDSNSNLIKMMFDCGYQWAKNEEKQVIRIVFKDLDGNHRTQVENILSCRDGVEYLVGEILLDSNVPVIDTLSHRNWKYEYWNQVRDNNYILEKSTSQ